MTFILRVALAIAVAFIITVITSKLLIPVFKRKKAQQHVRDDGPQTHLVKEGTPTMGGIMIVIGLIVATIMFSIYNGGGIEVLLIVLSVIGFALIGFLDDGIKLFKKRSLGLRAWQKIVLQLVTSFAIALLLYIFIGNTAIIIPFSGAVIDLGIGYIPFVMFVFLAMVNSVNLTDGLDGLATSLTLINSAAFLAIIVLLIPGLMLFSGYSEGTISANVAIFAAALIGACAGFLCFNKYPAKVFMGDTGSFALGAAITIIATLLGMQFLLVIMGLMFVLSSVSVILQVGSYKLRRKRIFKMAPLHHHFELSGMTETKVVTGYVLVTVVLSVVSILSVIFI